MEQVHHAGSALLRHGPANVVTGVRATFVAAATLALATSSGPVLPVHPLVSSLAALAILLDAVDGWVARRTRTVSAFGARFDMEVDAALILVLSVPAAQQYGVWVLLLGLARYLWAAAARLAPSLGSPIPRRRWRQAVAVVVAVTLLWVDAAAPATGLAVEALVVAGVLLGVSFASQGTEALAAAGRPVPLNPATVVAVGALWQAASLPPNAPTLDAAAWVRLPVELLGLLVLGLVVPVRVRRPTTVAVGLALTLLCCLRAADAGFRVAFDRPFDVMADPAYAGAGVDWVRSAWGTPTALGLGAGIAAALAALTAFLCWAVGRFFRLAAVHRVAGWRTAAAGLLVWLVALPVDGAVASHELVSTVTEQIRSVSLGLGDQARFARAIARPDQPPAPLALQGRDVLVVFVESYGQVALASPSVTAALRTTTERLGRSGFTARSAFLTSPTFGGLSWLAHSTLETGLWVDSPERYDALLASHRTSLISSFGAAGWRTSCVIPANTQDWPQGQAFYGCGQVLDSRNLGFAGPRLGYPTIPDQFTLAAFARRNLGPGHPPVMAEIDLVTSHAPWHPIPAMVPWGRLGDGSVYAQAVQPTPADTGTGYAEAIGYSWASLASFVAHAHDPNLVLVVLGDHQPNQTVSGTGASHDVPVSVITHDAGVLDRIQSWQWQPGLAPSTTAPVWSMDSFRDRFLTAFSG